MKEQGGVPPGPAFLPKDEIFARNIRALREKNPGLCDRLTALDPLSLLDRGCRIIPLSRAGYTAQVLVKGEYRYLHSRYDPEKESDGLVEKLIKDRYDIIFCGGFGLGFHVRSLFKKKSSSFSKLLVIEKDPGLLRLALALSDFTDLLKDERLLILAAENNDVPGLNDFLIQSVTKKCFTLILPFYISQADEFYSNLKNLIESYLSRKNINIATLSRFQNLWIYNIMRNHAKFLASRGIAGLAGRFNGCPALVVSAGPSLNENLELIRRNQDRFLIIAVDSVFPSLVRHGIRPDLVVTVDPQFINSKYFEYNRCFDPILVSDITAFPLTLKNYRGRTLFFSSVFPLARFVEKYTCPKGEIDMGGSVSTTAFDLAVRMGADPVILLGQDLAFLKERSHCKGSYVEKYWSLRNNRFSTSYNGLYRYINNTLFIRIRSSAGGLVGTDKRLMIFLVWFQNKMNTESVRGKKVYNTSLEGARMDKMTVLSFREVLSKNRFKDLRPAKEELKNLKTDLDPSSIRHEEFLSEIRKIRAGLSRLEELAKASLADSEKLYAMVKSAKKQDIRNLLNRLDANDAKIREYSEVTEFLSLLIQDRIYAILEDYENFLSPEEQADNDLKTAKRSIVLFQGIMESIALLRKFLPLMERPGPPETS